MSGMGELWPLIATRLQQNGQVSGVDLSQAMCDRARKVASRLAIPGKVFVQDALQNSIPDSSADVGV
jgi:ubiquinone/menaquinone biosynthesis C-methylase UbiE